MNNKVCKYLTSWIQMAVVALLMMNFLKSIVNNEIDVSIINQLYSNVYFTIIFIIF